MSARPEPSFTGEAHIIDLAAARANGAGKRTVERLCDGRRKGAHGNRASAATRQAVVRNLNDILSLRGAVTTADKEREADNAGVTPRTVNRWWHEEVTRKLHQAEQLLTEGAPPSTTAETSGGGSAGGTGGPDGAINSSRPAAQLVSLPRYLYRHADADRLQLTRSEIAFFARHTYIKDAIDAIYADPNHRLRHWARSTLYAAYANIAEPVRVGARKGSKAQRQIEATYPITGRDAINETWSIDEYDLKVTADYNGVLLEPKLLCVRERLSGTPLSWVVLPDAATGADTGKVLAAAAIGYTVPHPHDDPDNPTGRVLRVYGVARHLNSDQGGSFLGAPGVLAARRLGIGLSPRASHEPQANGDHEVMHQALAAHFVDGPGSRRTWTDRAGNSLDHGVIPFDEVVAQVEEFFATYLVSEHTRGELAGRTRLEVYADEVGAGNVFRGHDLTPADEAAVATSVGTRKYDATRGVLFRNQYWLGPELASAARPDETIELRQLLDPNILYAFTTGDTDGGKFIGILKPRREADLDDVYAVYADRSARQRFVRDNVAKKRAAIARQRAADLQAAYQDEVDDEDEAAHWNETADGLANAADLEDLRAAAEDAQRDDEPMPNLTVARRDAYTPSPSPDTTDSTRTVDEVRKVKAARHGRRSNPSDSYDPRDDATADEQSEAIADMFRRKRNTTKTSNQTSSQEDGNDAF